MNSRRNWLRLLSILPVWPLSATAATLEKTAKTAEGPFYPKTAMRTADVDNDLVKIDHKEKNAIGDIVYVTGQLTDISNQALSGLRVEIWQCDVNGRYLHPGDNNRTERDAGFQGFGHTFTDESGQYEFRTIKPVSYPGRAPHIHVKVFGDETVLTTQFYIKDHPENSNDVLFKRLSAGEQKAVEMDFIETNDRIAAVVDVVC